jgi:hypothetical protein
MPATKLGGSPPKTLRFRIDLRSAGTRARAPKNAPREWMAEYEARISGLAPDIASVPIRSSFRPHLWRHHRSPHFGAH